MVIPVVGEEGPAAVSIEAKAVEEAKSLAQTIVEPMEFL